jgi:calcineurin-like phosphoesterase
VLPNGTAFISDVGMVGSEDSILGMTKEPIIHQFVTQLPIRKEPSKSPPFIINAIHILIDEETGKATSIDRIYERIWEIG